MSLSDQLVDPDDYYSRGDVSDYDDKDSCGLSERGHVLALRVTSRQGKFGFSYHGYCGHDEDMGNPNPEWVTVYFRDTHEIEGKTLYTHWRLKVTGKRLENIIRHISLGRRTTLKEGGQAESEKPFVQSITVEAFEADHLDDE